LAIVSVKELLDSGVHFGHRASRWNPKMGQYIFGKRNLIHIIDLRETLKGLIRGYNFLQRLSADGREVLFVGTKRQAKARVEAEAKRCGMHYVTERWLGGTLTNFETITRRLDRLEELEAMEKDGRTSLMKKKEYATFLREKRKLLRNLEGIRNMKRLPGAVVIVDPRREHIAVKESFKLGIPTICLIDTDSDPELVNIPIPGNDDAIRSIEVVLKRLTDAIVGGAKVAKTRQGIETKRMVDEPGADAGGGPSAAPMSGGKRVIVRRVAPAKPVAEEPPAPEPEPEKPAPEVSPSDESAPKEPTSDAEE
jgi:small subunit ribosomal protein S2